LVQSI